MSDSQKIMVLEITGGVHAMPGVELEPNVILTQWSIRECDRIDGTRTRHLVGYDAYGREGRVSSTVVELNLEARTAKTKSGRIYGLKGDPGQHSDAEYVWQSWVRINKAKNDIDVTRSLWSQS
jgi:hypothetical protein